MIRHIPSGLFSKGGDVDYTKNTLEKLSERGKMWTTRGSLRSHLSLGKYNDDFEVLECIITPTKMVPIAEEKAEAKKTKDKRNAAKEKRMAEYRKMEAEENKKKAQAEIDRLLRQYPDLAGKVKNAS